MYAQEAMLNSTVIPLTGGNDTVWSTSTTAAAQFVATMDENDTLNRIFVITLISLIAIANVLMGCEVLFLNIIIK
jgi:steroid 5-alpha reductase family enzyme